MTLSWTRVWIGSNQVRLTTSALLAPRRVLAWRRADHFVPQVAVEVRSLTTANCGAGPLLPFRERASVPRRDRNGYFSRWCVKETKTSVEMRLDSRDTATSL